MKLWKRDTTNWAVREVDGDPWPGSDSEGDPCFGNTHFTEPAGAWESLREEATEQLSLANVRMKLAQQALLRAQAEVRDAQQALFDVTERAAAASRGCMHGELAPGPRVPLIHGSAPTEVCSQCGAWRTTLHRPGPWQYEPIAAALDAEPEH